MQTDKISFGQTRILPSVKYLDKRTTDKLPYLFGFGELYPIDFFIGSTPKGNLTVDIMHSTPAKHIFLNLKEEEQTFSNIATLSTLHFMENATRLRQGIRIPVLHTEIKNADELPVRELQYTINDKIRMYYDTLAKKFLN